MWITMNYGKFLKKQEYQTTLPASLEDKKKKKKTESDKEHWAVSKSGKEWVKAVYCHLLI